MSRFSCIIYIHHQQHTYIALQIDSIARALVLRERARYGFIARASWLALRSQSAGLYVVFDKTQQESVPASACVTF